MKKYLGILGALAAFALASCLPPIGFDPDFRLGVDANVEGEISVVSPDAMLIIQNHTQTLNITSIEVRDPEYSSYVATVLGKPLAGYEKVLNLRPKTDKQYEITFKYEEVDPRYNIPAGPNSTTNPGWDWGLYPPPRQTEQRPKTIEIALPVKGLYYLHFFRRTDGSVGITLNPGLYEDSKNASDNQDSRTDPEDSPDEGQTDGGLNGKNKDKLGLLVVKNLTGLNTNFVDFDFTKTVNGEDVTVKHFSMAPGPKGRDQRSILLGPGDWATKVNFTVDGTDYNTTPRNVTIAAGRIFFAYFYKTRTGYAVTTTWPPLVGPGDPEAPDDGNANPDDIVGDGEGILEVTNKSTTGTVVEKIRLGGDEREVMMLFDDVKRFVLPVGDISVAFKPWNQSAWGFTFTREIKSKQVTKISYVDSLGNPDRIPPEIDGKGSGLIKIYNYSTGVVTAATIVDINDTAKLPMVIPYSSFIPAYSIGYGRSGNVPVIGTNAFPITAGPHYLVQVDVDTPSGGVTVERLAEIKDQIVEIKIGQSELEDSARRGSKVTVINQTSTASTIIGMRVYDALDNNNSAVYGMTVPNGNQTTLYVTSTSTLPIIQGRNYVAELTVFGNGNIGLITKNFTPDSQLFSTNPDAHLRTVTLVQADIEGREPPLVEDFIPVTGITGIPSELVSVLANSYGSPAQWGSMNLNSVAIVRPHNPPDTTTATNRTIEWSVVSSGTTAGGLYNFNPATGALTVTGGDIADTGKKVRLQAIIRNGQGTAAAKTDYIKSDIDITLTYQYAPIIPKPVTSIGVTGGNLVLVKDSSYNLTQKVQINPSDAQIGGVPITANNLVWTVLAGGSGNVTQSGTNGQVITAAAVGTLTMRGTLPAASNGTGGEKFADISVQIIEPPNRRVRIIHRNSNDSIESVAFIPVPPGDIGTYWGSHFPTYKCVNGSTCNGMHIFQTGHTGRVWPNGAADTYLSGFQTRYPNADYRGLNIKNTWKDVSLPAGKYYVFFIEKDDKRVRGYVNPGVMDPATNSNFFFYLDTEQIEDRYFIGREEKPSTTFGGSWCIPIFYESYYNIADIGAVKLK